MVEPKIYNKGLRIVDNEIIFLPDSKFWIHLSHYSWTSNSTKHPYNVRAISLGHYLDLKWKISGQVIVDTAKTAMTDHKRD